MRRPAYPCAVVLCGLAILCRGRRLPGGCRDCRHTVVSPPRDELLDLQFGHRTAVNLLLSSAVNCEQEMIVQYGTWSTAPPEQSEPRRC